ncbi:GAF domain-containing protein [Psychrosphaera sp. B3R10]|uniref:GAF domain-containing protein n=1 Tax=unclassified Psychrosphaera TaxID=2641570 RepID=UPI001C08E2E3|nr:MULTISPECIES: GAF domain-containing protein [unclassified Psychrosphaera]MBU2883498.1 GAF domain-containing protein [Psychrosphaera sp. I2R16]MBU2989677.1 GAF domain-containing protein [Psychrosphaera sp. B3R10]MDO6719882.1 GAF domain-containing protein [Psychrosphaera sp. 1_MG-2023]
MHEFLNEIVALRMKLGFETAIISKVLDRNYYIEVCQSDHISINKGDIFNLEDTYCQKVISAKQIVTYNSVEKNQHRTLHPAYKLVQLLSYIGCPIYKDGVIWGTLNFSSTAYRHKPLVLEEIEYVTNLAEKISLYLDT